jgi:hypothetical protein
MEEFLERASELMNLEEYKLVRWRRCEREHSRLTDQQSQSQRRGDRKGHKDMRAGGAQCLKR